jgi:hypothetical protein
VGLSLEIALLSLYRFIFCSMDIIPAISDTASCETVL